MKRVVLAILGLLLSTAVLRADSLVITRPTNGTDSVNWSQLGSPSTSIPNPFSFITANGVSGNGTYATGNGDYGNHGSVYLQGANWAGNFTHGDYVNWTENEGAITLNFARGYTQIGAQIEEDSWGAFTAQICDVNGCFTEDGVSNGKDDGSAIYIGIFSDSPIDWVTFSLKSASYRRDDFAIDEVTLNTPEPGTLLLMASGLATMAAFLRRRFARR
jgi:hypothetical protein